MTWNPSLAEESPVLPPVTLILLTWNRWELTRRCLETLLASDLSGAELLVVDNGSTDGTPERLAAFPQARVLALPANLGFVRGNNAGIAAVPPDNDVVLLNNDVEFPRRDWLQRLRAAAHSAPDVGVPSTGWSASGARSGRKSRMYWMPPVVMNVPLLLMLLGLVLPSDQIPSVGLAASNAPYL